MCCASFHWWNIMDMFIMVHSQLKGVTAGFKLALVVWMCMHGVVQWAGTHPGVIPTLRPASSGLRIKHFCMLYLMTEFDSIHDWSRLIHYISDAVCTVFLHTGLEACDLYSFCHSLDVNLRCWRNRSQRTGWWWSLRAFWFWKTQERVWVGGKFLICYPSCVCVCAGSPSRMPALNITKTPMRKERSSKQPSDSPVMTCDTLRVHAGSTVRERRRKCSGCFVFSWIKLLMLSLVV